MKKTLIVLFGSLILFGCNKENEILPNVQQVTPELVIASSVGIKLQSLFVTSEVAMNVKSQVAGTATIKIFDISNKVVSKETINLKVGDNLLKVYTSALPSSAYRIGFYDANGKEMGITDFNKLN
jgi:uncharacterized protein YcfL